MRRGLGAFVAAAAGLESVSRRCCARQIAERALREAFRHGLLASDLLSALKEIAPGQLAANSATPQLQRPRNAQDATPKPPSKETKGPTLRKPNWFFPWGFWSLGVGRFLGVAELRRWALSLTAQVRAVSSR